MAKLFGTDGIRGVANLHPMTADIALRVGRAAGEVFRTDKGAHTILIGKDTRQSGYMIETALTSGLCSAGVDVLLVGPLPTPGVSYIMRSLRCDAAIMISASHNAYADNGIKFFARDGFKLPDEVEEEIERLVLHDMGDLPPEPVENVSRARVIQQALGRYMTFVRAPRSRTDTPVPGLPTNGNGEKKTTARPTGAQIGGARRIDDAVGRYIEFAKATFPKGMRLDGMRIVCDAAHGACYKVGPSTLSELGADVVPIGCSPNGVNINDACGSVHPEAMRAAVIQERADIGIAFDGDGDRIVMADEEGRLLDGNALLAVLGTDMLERNCLPHNTVVSTIMANGGLQRALEAHDGKVLHTKVGDRHVVEAMNSGGMTLGGESSGHLIMLDHNTTGDALIASLQILATMIRRERSLADLSKCYESMPEAHKNVPLNGHTTPSKDKLDKVIAKAEAVLEGKGRVVIRPSGTEPLIRIMVQHDYQNAAEALVEELAQEIRAL